MINISKEEIRDKMFFVRDEDRDQPIAVIKVADLLEKEAKRTKIEISNEWNVDEVSDLIKAHEKSKKEIVPVCKVTFDKEELQKMVDEKAREIIAELKERLQGEWKRHDEWSGGVYIGGFYHVNCPCEDGYYSKWETNFCPNCGLPMRKDGAKMEVKNAGML